jgi:antagonist of KipI
MPSVIIESAGLLTTVQDTGRYGYQRYGMPVAGAMDIFSLQLANILAGNKPGDACLEATFTGPEITFTSAGAFAVCGADMTPCKNGMPVPVNRTIAVRRGDKLSFAGLNSGCRSYIAFAGGIDLPPVMGSRSTYLRAKLGGFDGRALRAGDELLLGEISGKIAVKEVPGGLLPDYRSPHILRILPGPEISCFSRDSIWDFLNSAYTVTDQFDRMGYRLSGKPVKHETMKAGIISAGISPGTIQVPGNGQPIILMADRQTTGGYTRIADIISADLTIAAQMKPGDEVHFREVSPEKALQLLASMQRLLK